MRAMNKVWWAKRDGLLIKPERCERCGDRVLIEGHHDDYAKPLEVRWVCQRCHQRIHRHEIPERFPPMNEVEIAERYGVIA